MRACLKAMSVEVERLSDEEDVAALRKAFDVRQRLRCLSLHAALYM